MRGFTIFNTLFSLSLAGAAAVPTPATEAESLPALTWQPTAQAGQKWQIILSTTLSMGSPLRPYDAQIWDLDLFETDDSTIATLKSMGKNVICYFSAGTSESTRSDLYSLSPSDYGAGLPDWPGERWLNLRSERVWQVMAKRIALAAQKGCDAVDPDNMDGYSNENGGGFYPPLSTSDSVTFLKRMAALARSYGMSIGLKNAMDILPYVTSDIQFAVNEECIANSECDVYNSLISSGKPILHIEYGSAYETYTFCSNPYLNTVIKDMDLDGWVHYCDGTDYTSATEGSWKAVNGTKEASA